MKYLCLVYGAADSFADSSGNNDHSNHHHHNNHHNHHHNSNSGDTESLAYAESLAGSGRLLASELLAADYATTRVRVRQGRVAIMDGAVSEQMTPLAGFFLLTARDLNEAIHLASGIPLARVGWVEIRPVRMTA